MKEYDDEELVLRAQKGEEAAFNTLYKRYHKRLEFIAIRLCQNQEDAKDVVQQTFLQVHMSIQSLREPKRFYHWCCKILHGKCTDLFRKNKDVNVDMDHSPLFTSMVEDRVEFVPQKHHRFTSDRSVLLTIIEQLPYVQRQVVMLVYFEQMSMQECAEVLNVPEGTVKSRLYTAKSTLKKKVEEYNLTSNSPLNFQDVVSGSLIIAALMYAWKAYSFSTYIPKPKTIQFNPAILAAGVVAVTGIAGVGTWIASTHSQNEQVPIQKSQTMITYDGKEVSNAKEAYFILRNWAVDERQMKDRDEQEIIHLVPLYEYLKESNSTYYEILQQDAWSIAFETILR